MPESGGADLDRDREGHAHGREPRLFEWNVMTSAGRTKIVRTATGDIDPASMGVTLVHEHLCGDWEMLAGDIDVRMDDPAAIQAELHVAAAAGIGALVDATTFDIPRRHLELTPEMSHETGVQLILGCGYYLPPTYPPDVAVRDDAWLAERMVEGIVEGIGGGPRAGTIGEVGSSGEVIEGLEEKVFRATARAHRATGVAVITHTMEGVGALAQLDLLTERGVDPAKIVIGHLDCTVDWSVHARVAKRGAFVGFDRIGLTKYQSDESRVDSIKRLLDGGLIDHIVLSGDCSRRSRLTVNGGGGYASVVRNFVPMLVAAGASKSDVDHILVNNPRRLLEFQGAS
jgi:phosphotriesterase-related protein